jgi:hypothetical protein
LKNPPYTVFGYNPSNGNYAGNELLVGKYTVEATAYPLDNQGGTKIDQKMIHFDVT